MANMRLAQHGDAITLESTTLHVVRVDVSDLAEFVTSSSDSVEVELFFGYRPGTGRPLVRRVRLNAQEIAQLSERHS